MSDQYYLFPGEIWENIFSRVGGTIAGRVCLAASPLRIIYLPSGPNAELSSTASRVWTYFEARLDIDNTAPRLMLNSLQLVKNYLIAYRNLEEGRSMTEILVEDKSAPPARVDRYFHNSWIEKAPNQRLVYIEDPVMSSHEPAYCLGFVDFSDVGRCRSAIGDAVQLGQYAFGGGYYTSSKPMSLWRPGTLWKPLVFESPKGQHCVIKCPKTPPGFVDDGSTSYLTCPNQDNDFPQLLIIRTRGAFLSSCTSPP